MIVSEPVDQQLGCESGQARKSIASSDVINWLKCSHAQLVFQNRVHSARFKFKMSTFANTRGNFVK